MSYDFSILKTSYAKYIKGTILVFVGICVIGLLAFTLYFKLVLTPRRVDDSLPVDTSSIDNFIGWAVVGTWLFWFLAIVSIATWAYFARKKAVRKFVTTYNLKETTDPASKRPEAVSGPDDVTDIYFAYSFPVQGSKTDFIDIIEYNNTTENSRRGSTDYTVASFKSKHELPHLLIDAKANGVSHRYAQNQRLRLEGNFNDHFTLYAPDMADIEALQILAPDIMRLLIDSGSNYDIETNGTLVTVFSKGRLFNSNDLPLLLDFSELLHRNLAHKSVRWEAVKAVGESSAYGDKSIKLQTSLVYRYGRWALLAAVLAYLFGSMVM